MIRNARLPWFRPRRRTQRARVHERHLRMEPLEDRTLLSLTITETEPNDTMWTAEAIPLGFDPGEADVITVKGYATAPGDRDWFRVELNAGDVLGATIEGQHGFDPEFGLWDGDGSLLIFNDNHRVAGYKDFLLPHDSPLPTMNAWFNVDAAIYYVISQPGTYYIGVRGYQDASVGKYQMELVVARPGMEAEPVGTKQILFVDFDGATVDLKTFGYPPGERTLSPMRDFLPRWGLPADEATENAVIDAILQTIEENLSLDVRERGLNGDFDIEIRNSRDHVDEFGTNPYVSRVIIGGTEAEAGVGTFAMSQCIDPGNFSFDDDAFVLLDRRSEPAGHPQSLNSVPIDPSSSMIALVGVDIGTLASHEAGHYFGNFHTDMTNDVFNVMDPGGPRGILDATGTGPDGTFGSPDDVDVDFGVDDYGVIPALGTPELFTGVEDTLNTIAFGLSTGKAAVKKPDSATLTALSTEQSERLSSTNVTSPRGEEFDAALLWLTELEDKDERQDKAPARRHSAELTDLVMAGLG